MLFQVASLVLILCALVGALPFMDDEGSASPHQDILHGRFQVPRGRYGSFQGSTFFRHSEIRSHTFFLHKSPVASMDEEALQKKLVWERAIHSEKTRSYPDQVLPIGPDALKRSRCHALPFSQNVFKENCFPLRIPNKFCFGQCHSFFVPGWPSGLYQPCATCAPSRSRRVSVPIHCRDGHLAWQEVEMIEECECETHYDEITSSRDGSGEGFLPVS